MKNRKSSYFLNSLSLTQVNRILSDIGLRLDSVQAYGQSPDFHGKPVRNIGSGGEKDAIRLEQAYDKTRLFDALSPVFKSGEGINIELNNEEKELIFSVVSSKIEEIISAYLNHGKGIAFSIDETGLSISVKDQPGISNASTSNSITNVNTAPADAAALALDINSNLITAAESRLNSQGAKINQIISALEAAEILN